jgi:hypothetical protein
MQYVQAKNAIPGLGKPITAIDITFDSRWVLATTDDYLLMIRADYEDDKGMDSHCSNCSFLVAL